MAWSLTDLVAVLEEHGVSVVGSDDEEVRFALSGDAPSEARPARIAVASSSTGRLLAFSVTYPFTAPEPERARLAGAALAPYLVLGHTVVDDDGAVHHRYGMVVESGTLPSAVLGQVVALLDYEQLHFGDYLESVCVRGTSLEMLPDLIAAGEAGPAGDLA